VSEVYQRSNWFVWVSYSPISNSMFRVVFTNDDDIDCDGDDLGVPEEDFCDGHSFDPYLRVYAVVVGDFEFSDYSENGPPTKIIWLLLTMFGTVILLNVLIASKLQVVIVESALCLAILTCCLVPVVSLSYASCQQSSIILFRR
jgi:hypothetical protein